MKWTLYQWRNASPAICILLLVAALGDFTVCPAADKTKAANPDGKGDPSQKFFNDPKVRTFDLEVAEEGIASLRRSTRTYVSGTVREGGRVLTNVGVHLKGMGSFRAVDEKASFVLKFDEFATNQEYYGLTKLMLNNAVQDPTYLVEWLATGLFRDAHLPAARVTHARVRLNGRDLGLYVAIEAMNKRFLKRHFSSAKGNLYEAYVRDINTRMEQDNGDSTDQADVRALVDACSLADANERWRRVNQLLDVDRFVSFAAMEVLVGHWDGYAIHTNNYRLYHDPLTDKMVFITHGLDWAFRRPNLSIQPPLKSIVGRAVLGTEEGARMFRERIGTLFTNVYRVSVITQRMEQALAKIRTTGLTANELTKVERATASIRERIELRGVRLAEQLAGKEPPQTKFDADGTARLSGWRDENDRGEATMDQPTIDGRRTLHIRANGERTRGSWRAQVFLPHGRYRFEGMARAEGILSGSAGLRISGSQRSTGLRSTTGWQAVFHDFEVTEPTADAEFVCDFYGRAGEVWFDLDAFQVRRM